jgi:hypothetical protein
MNELLFFVEFALGIVLVCVPTTLLYAFGRRKHACVAEIDNPRGTGR